MLLMLCWSSSDDTATVCVLSLPKFFMPVCYNSSHGIHSERPDFVREAASEWCMESESVTLPFERRDDNNTNEAPRAAQSAS